MATLVRMQVSEQPAEQDESLRTSVPKPFPTAEEREQLLHAELLEELAEEQVDYEVPESRQPEDAMRSSAAPLSVNYIASERLRVSDGYASAIYLQMLS